MGKRDDGATTRETEAGGRKRGRPPRNVQPKAGEILESALRAFARRGFDGVNLRDIAADADVNVSLIIHQWGSKQALWRAVVDHVGGVFGEATRDAIERGADTLSPAELLVRAINDIVDTTCDVPERGLLLIQDIATQGERLDYLFERLVKPTRELILPLIRRISCRDAGETPMSGIDPEILTLTLAGAVATGVAMRPLMARFTAAAEGDEFRSHLKAALGRAFCGKSA